MKIPGVYVEIKGDSAQLKKDMTAARQIVTESAQAMSRALNGALSPGQIKTGTNKLIESLSTLSRASTNTGKVFDKLGVDLKHLQSVTGVTGTQFQQLQSKMLATQGAKAQEKALRDVARAANLTQAEIRALGQQFGLSNTQIKNVSSGTGQAASSFTMLGGAARAALAFLSVQQLFEFGKAVLDTGIKLDALERSFVAITGSTAGMQAEFVFLKKTAADTGQNFYDLTNSFRDLTASTKDTQLEGEKTRQIFTAISEAGAVLGLSSDRIQLAFLAISQMASKGTVSMEELRRQLGDQLPGAVNISARAMGMATSEFIKMVSEGKVLAEDLLPKLASELHNMYGAAANTAALESGQAAVNRLAQAWTEFKANLYDNKKAVASINMVTNALEAMSGMLDSSNDRIVEIKRQLASMPVPKQSMFGGDTGFGGDEEVSKRRAALNLELGELKANNEAKLAAAGEYAVGREKIEAESAARLKSIREQNEAAQRSHFDQEHEYYTQQDEETKAAIIANYDERAKAAEKGAEKQGKAEMKAYDATAEARKRLAEDVTDALAKEGMTQTQQLEYELKKQYKADLELAGNDIKLAKQVTEAYQIELKKRTKADNDYAAFAQKQHLAAAEKIKDGWQVAAEGRPEADRIANERIEKQNSETASVVTEEWNRAFESIQGYLADSIYEFDFSMDKILDIFKRMLAEMLAAIIMSGIKDAFVAMFTPGMDMWSAFTGGMARAAGFGGSMGGGYGSFSGNENVAGAATSGWGKVGGGLMVAGGAYGMYSGAQNLKKGNIGAGSLQLGLGGLSAYQGAVMLGIVEKGAFTAGMNALGAKIGLTVAPKVAATVAASVGAPSASLAAAESAYLAGSAPAAPALSAAPTAAATGTPALATAAAYAVPALAAGLAIKGIIDKGNRPSASAEIDEFGVTPDNLAMFNDQLTATNGTILATVPTLQKYNQAIYDTETQVLTLTNGTKQLQLQYDAADQAGHQWSSTITGGTSIMSSAAAEIIDAFAPLPLSVDQVHEASQLAGQAFEHMASGSELAGRSMNKLEGYLQDLGMSEDQAAIAAQQLIDNVEDLGGAAAASASVIAGSASEINRAFRSMESLSSENFDSSAYSSHLVGGTTGDSSFHADGGVFNSGVFTRATRFGRDVFGEAGAEAAIPLHAGPDTLKYMDGKLDQILSGGGNTIIFQVSGQEVKRVFIPWVDEHIVAKASRGQLATRTAYAAR